MIPPTIRKALTANNKAACYSSCPKSALFGSLGHTNLLLVVFLSLFLVFLRHLILDGSIHNRHSQTDLLWMKQNCSKGKSWPGNGRNEFGLKNSSTLKLLRYPHTELQPPKTLT